MTENEHLGDHLRSVLAGPAWHGPALRELLDDVSADVAAAHPIAGVHSIWEIVLHCTAWHRAVLRRMEGESIDLDGEADWPPVTDRSVRAWQAAQEDLARSVDEVTQSLHTFAALRLDEHVPGKAYTFAAMLYGLAGHDLYHAGQIALLKRAR